MPDRPEKLAKSDAGSASLEPGKDLFAYLGDKAFWIHAADSIGLMILCLGFSSWIYNNILGLQGPFLFVTPTLTGVVLLCAFSFGLHAARPIFGIEGAVHHYLRTCSYLTTLFPIVAVSFYFPKSVMVLCGLIVGGVWIFVFQMKFQPKQYRFAVSASALLIAILIYAVARVPNTNTLSMPSGGVESSAAPTSTPPLPVTQAPAEPAAPAQVAPAVSGDLHTSMLPTSAAPAPNPVAAAAPAEPSRAPASGPAAETQVAAASAPIPLPTITAEPTGEHSSIPDDPLAKDRFFKAVKSGNVRLVKDMIDKRTVDVMFMLDQGSNALHYASADGNLPLVKLLVQKGAVVNAQDPSGTTPLMWAVYKKHYEVCQYLLAKKADMDLKRDDGQSAYDIAKRSKKPEFLELFENARKEKQRKIASEKEKAKKAKHSNSRLPQKVK